MPRKSRNTKQKEIIHDKIEKTNDFFTAEYLYNSVKKVYNDIGLATVYRFLKELRKKKKIHAYTCNGRLLYSKDKKSHCHFVCEETGKIMHFDVDSLDFLKNKIPGSITSFQIEVKGKCNDCIKTDKNF
jgi:Fe2+ or Zn2+ uptake regulation protein